MHEYNLILTLTGGLSVALFLGYLTQRIGLSPIVGYLIAGTLVGPNTPGFVADSSLAEQLAEVGVILLMFGVGLQFHLSELLAVKGIAIPGALAQSAAATAAGAVLAHAVGWDWSSGVLFGIALSVASTVVLIRVLSDHNALHSPAGHIAVGWLVVEDLLTVLALVLLPTIFGQDGRSVWSAIALTVVKVSALVVFTMVVGARVIPRVLDHVAATRSRELFTLSVLVIALGIAVGSSALFGVSMALGAFLAGMVVGRSEYSLRAASDALPFRDAFAVLFFVSVGMLLDPRTIFDNPGLVAGALAIVLVGKPLVAWLIMLIARQPLRSGLIVAAALAQIGEFSFILSTLGRDLGLLSREATNTLVATAIISIVINPIVFRAVTPFSGWLGRQSWSRALDRSTADPVAPGPARSTRYRSIVVGYGPTGRTVCQLLRENDIHVTVVDLNVDAIRELRADGIDAVYGDATRPDTMDAAGIDAAGSLILTSAGMESSTEAIRNARERNPAIRVLARASYLRDLPELTRAGADTVFTGEGEVALAFVESILERLGATAEQIDRGRDRAHRELFGGKAT